MYIKSLIEGKEKCWECELFEKCCMRGNQTFSGYKRISKNEHSAFCIGYKKTGFFYRLLNKKNKGVFPGEVIGI